MCYYIPLCYREYAADVLDYFHWRDYLLFKKQIITPKYHKKKRYSVKFFDKDKLFFIKNYLLSKFIKLILIKGRLTTFYDDFMSIL